MVNGPLGRDEVVDQLSARVGPLLFQCNAGERQLAWSAA